MGSVSDENKVIQAAKFHSKQAMEFLRTQQYEQANESFRKAFRLYSNLRDYVKVGCVVHQLGVSYREQGNIQGALAMLKKASDIFLKVKPTPRYDCLANAVFDTNICYSRDNENNQCQAYLKSIKHFVPYFPLVDQVKFFYNLSLAQLKQGFLVPAVLGFGLAIPLLQTHIQRESLTEQCPRGLVNLLANAHLNQAEALTQLVAELGSYAEAQKVLEVEAVKHERKEANTYLIVRQRGPGRSTGQGPQQGQGSINNVGSHVSHVTKGTVVAPLNHQEKMRALMPPPPPRTPNRQRIKDKMQGTGRTERDVKRKESKISANMRTGHGHHSIHKARRVRSPKSLRIDLMHTAKRNQQSNVAPLHVNDRKQAQLLRDHIELVYRKALDLHLKAARSGSASTSNSNLELAAYSIQQLVRLFHATGQGAKSQALLHQCQSLTCLTSNPRYQPHFLKWFRELQNVRTSS